MDDKMQAVVVYKALSSNSRRAKLQRKTQRRDNNCGFEIFCNYVVSNAMRGKDLIRGSTFTRFRILKIGSKNIV